MATEPQTTGQLWPRGSSASTIVVGDGGGSGGPVSDSAVANLIVGPGETRTQLEGVISVVSTTTGDISVATLVTGPSETNDSLHRLFGPTVIQTAETVEDIVVLTDSVETLQEKMEATELATPLAIQAATANLARSRTPALGLFHGAMACRNFRSVFVAFVGSSTVAGTHLNPPSRWPDKLMKSIHEAYPLTSGVMHPPTKRTFTGVPNHSEGIFGGNFGVPGATAVNYITDESRATLIAMKPAVMFHSVGLNEWRGGTSTSTYKANLISQLDQLDAATTTRAPILHILIHAHERGDNVPATRVPWATYGQAMQEIADARPNNVAFINLRVFFDKIGLPHNDMFGLMESDIIHLTGGGFSMFADIIATYLGLTPAPSLIPDPGNTRLTSDDFTDDGPLDGRVSNAALGGSPRGWLSSTDPNGFSVVNNALVPSGSSAKFSGFIVSGYGEQASLLIRAAPTAGLLCLDMSRNSREVSNTPDTYRIEFSPDTVRLLKRVNSVTTELYDATFDGGVVGAVYTIRYLFSVISIHRNGVMLASFTDTSISPNGYAGLSRSNTLAGGLYDRFTLDVLN